MTVIERTNLRYLPSLPQKVDVVTLDLSFISILKVSLLSCSFCFQGSLFSYGFETYEQVMPAVMNVMNENATLVTLVKPQFEARRSQVLLIHQTLRRVLNQLYDSFTICSLTFLFLIKVGKGGIIKDPEVHQEVCMHPLNVLHFFVYCSSGFLLF